MWYREDELLTLAKEYANLKGYTYRDWGIGDANGRMQARSYRHLLAKLFQWRLIDWIDWKDPGFPWQRRYFLSLDSVICYTSP